MPVTKQMTILPCKKIIKSIQFDIAIHVCQTVSILWPVLYTLL